MPPSSVNKAALYDFEAQMRHHQKSKTRVSVAQKKDLRPSEILQTKNIKKKSCSFLDLPVDTVVREVVVVVALVYWVEGVRALVTPPGVYSAVVDRVTLWIHFYRHTLRHKKSLSIIKIQTMCLKFFQKVINDFY